MVQLDIAQEECILGFHLRHIRFRSDIQIRTAQCKILLDHNFRMSQDKLFHICTLDQTFYKQLKNQIFIKKITLVKHETHVEGTLQQRHNLLEHFEHILLHKNIPEHIGKYKTCQYHQYYRKFWGKQFHNQCKIRMTSYKLLKDFC